MKRLAWVVWWAGAVGVVFVIGCVIWARWSGRANFAHRDSRELSSPLDRTRIAVFGDTQKGLASFAALGEIAKLQHIDLAMHTGDLVSHADVGHYDLALTWVERARLGVPFVVVPGNHDIKGGDGLFERRIGPRQFAFRWGPVDIVVVDNAVAPPGEAAVERMLSDAKGPILLFMHVPPNDTSKSVLVPKSAYTGFLEMIRKYPVRYVFSGHAHAYSRVESDAMVFISNGVGGDSDSWQFDQKAHLTVLDSDGKTFSEQLIVIEPVFSVWANIEHLAIGHVGEIVLRRTWGIPALLLLILALFLGYRRLRRKRKLGTENEKLTVRFTPAKTSEPPDIVI